MPPINAAPAPMDEPKRLIALRRRAILDTGREEFFDSVTQLAAELCGTPISLVTFVDADRQWFKSRVGLDVCETPRDVAFCAHAILQSEVFVIPDTRADPRFATNPLVAGEPYIRFYAGAPITTGDGYRLGTVCVIDREPRTLGAAQEAMLRVLSHYVAAELDRRAGAPAEQQRKSAAALWQSKKKFFRDAVSLQSLYCTAPVGLSFLDPDLRFAHVNEWFARIVGESAVVFQGRTLPEILPTLAAQLGPLCRDVLHAGKEISELELEAVPISEAGSVRDLRVSLSPLKGSGGEILGISWVMQDITEHRRLENTLRRGDQQTDLILDRSNDGFMAVDVDGRITEWNIRAEAIFGWTRSEVIGRLMADAIIPARSLETCMSGLRHFLATGAGPLLNQRSEVAGLHRDGHEFPILLSITPVRTEGTWLLSAFVRDLSMHRLSERQFEEQTSQPTAANTRAAKPADPDGLTGLKSRLSFHQRLDELFEKAQHHRSPLSVIKLDIDHFKRYNDLSGRAAGDKLLRTLASLLLKKARSYDFVARYGDDEFAIILPRTDSHGAAIMGDRFRRSIGHTFGPIKAITVSCGIATTTAATPRAEVLLNEADQALSEAKRQGRNRVVHAETLVSR